MAFFLRGVLKLYDLIIIGGGVIGCSVAREISHYQVKTLVLEKESDLACGTSKSNSAIIHAGYDPDPVTLKARLNVEGNSMYSQICNELDIPFRRIGSLVVAFHDEDIPTLEKLHHHGMKNGVAGMKIINQNELRNLEPHIAKEALMALYAQSAGIICPFTLTIAMAENAAQNGVDFSLDTEVAAIDVCSDGHFSILTNRGRFESKYVVNSAGVFGETINNMAGGEPFSIRPRKGEYCILDKAQGYLTNTTIFTVPTKMGKGILVSPTVDGNLLIGPTAADIDDKEDTATTAEGLQQVIDGARRLVPGIQASKIITSFAGLRAIPDGDDFIIRSSKKIKGFVNAVGIESPGLTSAPAIAKMVRQILMDKGLLCEVKSQFTTHRKPVVRFRELSAAEQRNLIKKNPSYGKVICRCETITEGEIIDAIHRPLGARNLDGLKRRVRTGAGRCQGGFCTPRVAEILARELQIPIEQVTKSGKASYILAGKAKEQQMAKRGN
jgi:glycerol-3-phosphate dehydrogenase